MTREQFEAFISAPPFEMPIERFDDRSAWPGSYTELEVDLAWQAWKAATDAALERAAVVRMKLPPPKYGENASPIQAVYQDAFDRGWKAGIGAMRSAVRALKESKE